MGVLVVIRVGVEISVPFSLFVHQIFIFMSTYSVLGIMLDTGTRVGKRQTSYLLSRCIYQRGEKGNIQGKYLHIIIHFEKCYESWHILDLVVKKASEDDLFH